jgi:hypothetical protein
MKIIKIVTTGSRTWTNVQIIKDVLKSMKAYYSKNSTLEVSQGGAKGADEIVRKVCSKLDIKCLTFKAEWDRYGIEAGMIRNIQMLEDFQPDYVVAFWDEKSKGTKHCIDQAQLRQIKVIVFKPTDDLRKERV